MSNVMELADAYAIATVGVAVSAHAFGTRSEQTHHRNIVQKEARAALEAAVEALEKDAARYRWLREKARSRTLPMVRVQIMHQGQYVLHDGEKLDAAIDAARSET